MSRRRSEQPTEGELEILSLLWESGPMELGAITAGIREQRDVATTTVATMLKVMLEKGLVRRRKGHRAYAWSARVSRDEAAKGLVGRLIDTAFDGSAQRLLTHLFESGRITDRDREELRRLLGEARSRGRRKGP